MRLAFLRQAQLENVVESTISLGIQTFLGFATYNQHIWMSLI